MYPQYIRFSPIGEYLRLVILKRLSRGPAKVEEINELAKRVVQNVGIKYDWSVWPELLKREVVVKDGVVEITQFGKWIFKQTGEEVAEYVKKTLGVEP